MKQVLITGATSGFGKSLTAEFLKNGFRVIATGRNLSSRADIFKNERQEFGASLVELDLDVTSTTDIQKVSDYFKTEKLDILVNNAGYAVFGPAEECHEEQLRRQFEVNFFGLVLLTQKLLPALRNSKGHIFNFSSVMGLVGFPLSSLYCASKFAVEGFSESLSHELRPFGVGVTLIEPGGYRTNFNASAVWGMGEIREQSVYFRQLKNYATFRMKLASRPNYQDPNDVARGLVRIAQSHSPKISYSFGKDAMMTRVLKKTLPRAVFHRVMGRVLNKAMNSPAGIQ